MRRLSFLLVLFILLTPSISAAQLFESQYQVAYVVAKTGVTTVTQNIRLTNKESTFYPHEYKITLDSTDVSNIVARDSTGLLTPQVEKRDKKTYVTLRFADRAVGQGKFTEFTLRYEIGDIAKKQGSIWEIAIPPIPDDATIDDYTVSLDVPQEFGAPAYFSPAPENGRKWTKNEIGTQGIIAAFGNRQVYELTLSYHLKNNYWSDSVQTIAFPPDTAYQTVSLQSVSPLPREVVTDPDGNLLATYRLNPWQSIDVVARIAVLITAIPQRTQVLDDPSGMKKKDMYWNTTDSRIMQIAASLHTPKEIYTEVTETLAYDYKKVSTAQSRMSAEKILDTPLSALCMEYTDLFVTLARASGIPARAVVGFAHTTDEYLRPLSLVKDVLHAWPEYYDEGAQLWKPVDPTWADTTGGVDYFNKLDFNHIVFAIHGVSSQSPRPAGFYRTEASKKDVRVRFLDQFPESVHSQVSMQTEVPRFVLAGIPARAHLIFDNPSGDAADIGNVLASVIPNGADKIFEVTRITPFSEKRVSIPIQTPSLLSYTPGVVQFTVNGKIITRSFIVLPLPILLFPIGILIFLTMRIRKKR